MHPAQALLREIAVEAGPRRKVTFGRVFGGVLGLFGRSPPAVWGLALAFVAATYAADAIPAALGYGLLEDSAGWAFWVRAVAQDLVDAVITGLALRLWLHPVPRWGRLDRGLAGYVLIAGLGTTAATGLARLDDVAVAAVRRLPDAHAGAYATAVDAAGEFLWLLLTLMLMLWPISLAAGDRVVSPWRSWRLMTPAILPYGLACTVFALPLMVAVLSAATLVLWIDRAGTAYAVAEALMIGVIEVFGMAAAAVVYQVRVRGRADVAEVFD